MAENEPLIPEDKLVHPVMRKFLFGQFANLFKFALWWTTLAPLTFALFDKDPTAIGVGRIVYNVALCVMSPLGGIVCEKVHPKKVLLGAASVRFAIWCVMVPLTWFLFDSTIVTTSTTAIWVIFNLMLVFDGASVALSTVLDIDLCGVDIVAGRFGYEVTDEHRNQFNGRQELFFAACFTLFTPGMAFLGLAIHKAFEQIQSGTMTPAAMEAGTLIGIFVVTFAVATFLQFYFFSQLPPDAPPPEAAKAIAEAQSAQSLDENHQQGGRAASSEPAHDETEQPSGWDAVKQVPNDLKEALVVIWQNPPILFRLIFLGLEIAFEDAAIVVIASQMGITLPWLGDNDSVKGNIWTSLGVASGKLGGVVASFLMIHYYHPPTQPIKFVPIFALILLSCCTVLVFPATVDAFDNGSVSPDAARALYLVTFFVYFFLSTLPKLGLMGLLQSMVSQVENGPRVFGFIAIIATSFDALVIMGLSVVFVKAHFRDALWITAFIYLGHGVLEMIVGPLLVLRPLQAAADSHVFDETSHLTGAPKVVPEAPEPSGTYTQRSASILVGAPSDANANKPQSPRGESQRTAFISTSHSVAYASVRKASGLNSNQQPSASIAIPTTQRGDDIEQRRSVAASGLFAKSYTRQGSRLGVPSSPRQAN